MDGIGFPLDATFTDGQGYRCSGFRGVAGKLRKTKKEIDGYVKILYELRNPDTG